MPFDTVAKQSQDLGLSGRIVRQALAGICLVVVLTACGGGGGGGGAGGGGGGSGPSFSVSTHSLSFSASGAAAPTPSPQTVTGTVTGTASGTLYIVVNVTGPAVASVSNFSVSGNSGQASVSVKLPSSLGFGTFASTLTVHACLNDPTCATGELSGSPQTINVSYDIASPTLADVAMPHVIAAGMTGSVVLRGSGFTGTTAVSFGATAAASFTLVSDSMIRATYPASLTPGPQAITLTGSQQAFSGQVVAVGPQAYAAATLTYPSMPQRIAALVFDAQRQVLYVGADGWPDSGASQIWIYAYASGAWGSPAVIAAPELVDLSLSPDGSKLYALTATSIEVFDAANPTGSPPATLPAPFTSPTGPSLLHFALTNDGNALVETGIYGGTTVADTYLYSFASATFSDLGNTTQLQSASDRTIGNLVASGDGSLVMATQNAANGPSPAIFSYAAVSGIISPFTGPRDQFGQPWSQIGYVPMAIDTAGDRIVLTSDNNSWVLDGGADVLGALGVNSVQAWVDIVNPQGTRVYELRADAGLTAAATLHTFDLTAAPTGLPAAYPEIGAPVTQPIPSATQVLRTAITPDGATLFIAGDAGVAVIPAPN